MTPVRFHFITADGNPVANSQIQIRIPKYGYDSEGTEIALPQKIYATTDDLGQVTVDLYPNKLHPYEVQTSSWKSGAPTRMEFFVPESDEVVELRDIVLAPPPTNLPYDLEAIQQITQIKSDVIQSEHQIEIYHGEVLDARDTTLASEARTAESEARTATSETNAKASELAAADSQSAALDSQNAAALSESNAAASESAAAVSESNADTSEEWAEKWAQNPYNQEVKTGQYSSLHHATMADSHRAAALQSAVDASDARMGAETAETNAKASETAAAASESASLASENAAATSEANALASEQAASASEAAALASEQASAASEAAASTSEANAYASEQAAFTSETNAGASADLSKDWATSTTLVDGTYYGARKYAIDAEASENAAQASESAASSSASAAASSASSALASEQAAASSESAAAASETAAATSASNAATSETNAAQSATEADASETAAQQSEDAAKASELAASSSETNAASSETNAATSASNALASENAAALSESAAAQSELNASGSAADALTSENNAATSANTAETHKNAAAGSASAAAISETNAASSASASATSASNAATSESNAAQSASAASTSETNAASSASAAQTARTGAEAAETGALAAQTGAETARDQAEQIFAQFGDQYLGPFASDPTSDNSGNPLTIGDIYFDTSNNILKFYSGNTWVSPESVASNAASQAQASADDAEYWAIEAQTTVTSGILDDTQELTAKTWSSSKIDSELANTGGAANGYTDSQLAAHTSAADPHTQYAKEGDLASIATSGSYADLVGVPATFPASAHTHPWSEVTGKPTTATRWPKWSEVTSKPSTFPPATHNHDSVYLGITAKAADSDKVDGKHLATIESEYQAAADAAESAAKSHANTGLAKKLDSSAYTAADVLVKVKTVDGAGSGLDADTLDGKQASELYERSEGLPSQQIATVNSPSEVPFEASGAAANYPHLAGFRDGTGQLTFTEAVQKAAEYGSRLPTLEELDAGICGGTGHSYNAEITWTCTPAGPGKVWGMVGNGSGTPVKLGVVNDTAVGGYVVNKAVTPDSVYLDKIKRVDGPGSGLNADLLDGQHATAFADASHSHPWNEVNSKPATATRWPTFSEVTSKPTTATRWPTWSEVTSKPSTFTPATHNHSADEITSGVLGYARIPTIRHGDTNFANQSLNTGSNVRHATVRTGGTADDGTNSLQADGGTRTDTLAAGGVQAAEESIDTAGNVQIRDEGQLKMGGFAIQFNAATQSLDFNFVGS